MTFYFQFPESYRYYVNKLFCSFLTVYLEGVGVWEPAVISHGGRKKNLVFRMSKCERQDKTIICGCSVESLTVGFFPTDFQLNKQNNPHSVSAKFAPALVLQTGKTQPYLSD